MANKAVILVNSTDERRAQWVETLKAAGIEAEDVGGVVEVDQKIARLWLVATNRIVEKGLKGAKADKLRLKTLLEGYAPSQAEQSRASARASARFLAAERGNR